MSAPTNSPASLISDATSAQAMNPAAGGTQAPSHLFFFGCDITEGRVPASCISVVSPGDRMEVMVQDGEIMSLSHNPSLPPSSYDAPIANDGKVIISIAPLSGLTPNFRPGSDRSSPPENYTVNGVRRVWAKPRALFRVFCGPDEDSTGEIFQPAYGLSNGTNIWLSRDNQPYGRYGLEVTDEKPYDFQITPDSTINAARTSNRDTLLQGLDDMQSLRSRLGSQPSTAIRRALPLEDVDNEYQW